jgi:LysM repeat protein
MVFSRTWILFLLATVGLVGLNGCSLSDSGSLDEENEPHYILGKSRVNALDYSAAVDAFNDALQVNPHSAAAHYQLACLYDSENKVADPAAAIYHYQQFLKLNPRAENAPVVNQRIEGCKVQLAHAVTSLPSMPASQRLLESLSETNRALLAEVTKWRAYYAAQQQAASRPVPASGQNGFGATEPETLPPPENSSPAVKKSAPPRPASAAVKTRTHVVAKGESLAIIARKYRVSLASLQAANPGVNSSRLRVGQTINIPST